MKPKALIFDFDGLIVDTEVPVFEAWQTDYAAFGHELCLDEYVGCVGSDFGGFNPQTHLENLTGQKIDWAELDEAREKRARDAVNRMDPLPGIIPLLDEASEAGLPCVVASSSPRSWVERHLNRVGLFERFEFTRCLDDVSAAKPSPELFLAAVNGLGIDPESAVVFEDSLNGLKAADAAQIPCVIVPNQITVSLDFAGALQRVKSMEEVSLSWLRNLFNESAA